MLTRPLVLLALVAAGTAQAQPFPIPSPILSASVAGTPDYTQPIRAVAVVNGCYQSFPSEPVYVGGGDVWWIVTIAGAPCGTPPPPYNVETQFGPLPAGSYRLLVIYREPVIGELGPPLVVPFSVGPVSVPGLGAFGVTMLALVLLACGWPRLRGRGANGAGGTFVRWST